ncbi:MAG: hypothetical protein WCD68_08755, partial [Candidatus Acidiferrum sp.]
PQKYLRESTICIPCEQTVAALRTAKPLYSFFFAGFSKDRAFRLQRVAPMYSNRITEISSVFGVGW